MYRKNRGGVHLSPRVLGWGRSSSIELDVGDSSQGGILIWRKKVGVDSRGRSGGKARKRKQEIKFLDFISSFANLHYTLGMRSAMSQDVLNMFFDRV